MLPPELMVGGAVGERAPQPSERGTEDRVEQVIDRGFRRGLDAEQETAVDEDDPPDSLG